jgi:hypothetical protein
MMPPDQARCAFSRPVFSGARGRGSASLRYCKQPEVSRACILSGEPKDVPTRAQDEGTHASSASLFKSLFDRDPRSAAGMPPHDAPGPDAPKRSPRYRKVASRQKRALTLIVVRAWWRRRRTARWPRPRARVRRAPGAGGGLGGRGLWEDRWFTCRVQIKRSRQ